MTIKKKIRSYDLIKTRLLDLATTVRALFVAVETSESREGDQPKIKRHPDLESSNLELFTTCIKEFSEKKKIKKKPKMLRRPKLKYSTPKTKKRRSTKKCTRKLLEYYSDIQSTSSEEKLRLKETKYLEEPIQVSSSTCEPSLKNLVEHSLFVEQPIKEIEISYFTNKNLIMNLTFPSKNEEIVFPSQVKCLYQEKKYTNMRITKFKYNENSLSFSAKRNEPNLSNINEQFLTVDESFREIEITDSNNEESAEMSRNNLFKSSTPISKCHRSDKAQKTLCNAHSQNFIFASTPALHKEVHKPFTPIFNISRISKFSEKDNLGSNVLFPSTNITQFSLASKKMASAEENDSDNISGLRIDCATEHNSNAPTDKNNMNMNNLLPLLPLTNSNASNKKLACSSILQKPFETTCHQFSRSLEMHSIDMNSSKRNLRSSIEVDSFCTSLKSLDKNLECDLSKLLKFCQQDVVIGFKDVFDWSQASIKKISDGSYGEVFMVTWKRSSSVLKIIPFAETSDKKIRQTIESVFSEMKVAHCLSELRTDESNQTKNFNKLKSAKVVTGSYPNKLIDAWKAYCGTRKPCPDIFEENQIYAILELEYGGQNMAEFGLKNAAESECIFKQVAISLAIAEEAHFFEHRDLHLGNILVKRNNSKAISYILRGKPFSIQSLGLVVSIIDFTLSRVLDKGCVFYNDLANAESLFDQSGDYQFEVYKLTRQHLNNEWKKSILYSNVLWLNFLCKKLLNHEKYSHVNSKKHLDSLKTLYNIQNKLDNSKSALDVLQNVLTDYSNIYFWKKPPCSVLQNAP